MVNFNSQVVLLTFVKRVFVIRLLVSQKSMCLQSEQKSKFNFKINFGYVCGNISYEIVRNERWNRNYIDTDCDGLFGTRLELEASFRIRTLVTIVKGIRQEIEKVSELELNWDELWSNEKSKLKYCEYLTCEQSGFNNLRTIRARKSGLALLFPQKFWSLDSWLTVFRIGTEVAWLGTNLDF